MKLGILGLATAVVALFASCEELENLKTLSVNSSLNHTENIAIPTDGNALDTVNYQNTDTLLLDDPDLSEYDKIKSVGVTDISFVVSSYQGDPNGKLEGEMRFPGITAAGYAMEVPNMKDASDNASTFSISVPASDIETLNSYLQSNGMIIMQMAGTAFNAPMTFNVDFTIAVSAKVEIVE